MKKYIKQICILALIATFASCTPADEKVEMTAVGGSTVLTDTKISRLDINNDIAIKVITKEGVTVSKMEIYYNTAASTTVPLVLGTKITDATITGTTATFSSSKIASNSNFASNQATATVNIQLDFITTYSDGSTTSVPFTLAVARGINLSGTVPTTAKYMDPTTGKNLLKYAVYKKYAATVVNSVTAEWKKNATGTYAPVTGSFPVTSGSIDLGTIPYATYGLAVGDKLYYKFTVTSGTQKDYVETYVTIVTQELNAEKTATLTDDLEGNKFSLKTGLNYANTNTANAEIIFTTPFGISKAGTTAIDFVKSNSTNYATADLFKVQADYNAGTKVTSLINLAKDDVVIYKIVRGAVTSYGLIKVGDTNTTTLNGVTTSTIGIGYKEGTFL
jgi:uncharacterized protein YegP (UPF0339 family)